MELTPEPDDQEKIHCHRLDKSMTVDEHAKVIRFTGKHSPDQFSIFDFHALRSPVVQKLFQVSDELYSSSGGKFRNFTRFWEIGS